MRNTDGRDSLAKYTETDKSVISRSCCAQLGPNSFYNCDNKTVQSSRAAFSPSLKARSDTNFNLQPVLLSPPITFNDPLRPKQVVQQHTFSNENNDCLGSFSLNSNAVFSERVFLGGSEFHREPFNEIGKRCEEVEARDNVDGALSMKSDNEEKKNSEDQGRESTFPLKNEDIGEKATVHLRFSGDFFAEQSALYHSKSIYAFGEEVNNILPESIPESISVPPSPKAEKTTCCKKKMSLTCLLLWYLLLIVVVAVFSLLLPFYTSRKTLLGATEELHRHIRLEMHSQLHSVIDIPHTLPEVLTSLYIENPTRPSATDELVPMDFTMTQRLCSIIHRVDRFGFLTMVYVASVSRNEIAFCTRLYSTELFGTLDMSFDNGRLFSILAVDPVTLKRVEPPKILASMEDPITLDEFVNNVSGTGEILNEWKEAVDTGRTPDVRLWNVDYFLNQSFTYTYPFLEKDDTLSFTRVGVDFKKVMECVVSRQDHLKPSTRIMFLEDNPESSNILASNWQRSVRVAKSFPSCNLKSQRVSELPLHEIGDELMHTAVLHLNLTDIISRLSHDEPFFFSYVPCNRLSKGAAVSVLLVLSNAGTSVVAIIATPVKSLGKLEYYLNIIFTVVTVVGALVWILAYLLMMFCVSHPLRRIAVDLREAAKARNLSDSVNTLSFHPVAPLRERKAKRGEKNSMLFEIYCMQKVCFSLRNKLDQVRSLLPPLIFGDRQLSFTKLFVRSTQNSLMETTRSGTPSGCETTGNGKYITNSNAEVVDGNSTLSRRLSKSTKIFTSSSDINTFREVCCAVVSVHNTDLETVGEYGDAMAKVIMCAAQRYGGCVDVFSAELFHVSFGSLWNMQDKEFYATQCALEIDRELPAVFRSSCVIVVDSGIYRFGVCGRPERKEVVLFGRSIDTEVVYMLRRLRVTVAILETAAKHISQHIYLLPVLQMRRSSVIVEFFKRPRQAAHRMLIYTPIKDVWDKNVWQHACALYQTGFHLFCQSECIKAIQCFESLASQPHISAEFTRLLRQQIQLAQSLFEGGLRPYVRAVESKPRVALSMDVSMEGSERVDEAYMQSCDNVCVTHTVPHSRNRPSGVGVGGCSLKCDTHEVEYRSASTSLSSRTQHSSNAVSAVTVPHECWDKDMVHWTRAAEGFPESSRFPVFLGISDTGTLAALKVFPLPLLSVLGYSEMEELASVWSRGGTLYHENIVQILGYGCAKEHAFLIMEYIPGGTLRDCIVRYGRVIPPPAIRRCLVCTLRALEYLHSRGFVHGDVRPGNIMIGVEGRYKLTGMDTLRVQQAEPPARGRRGPPMYCSPELLATGRCSEASDIFAVGLVLLETAKNQTPWRWSSGAVVVQSRHGDVAAGEESSVRMQLARRSKLDLMAVLSDVERMRIAVSDNMIEVAKDPPGQCISDPLLNEVIDRCLAHNPMDRPSASKLLQMLSNMP